MRALQRTVALACTVSLLLAQEPAAPPLSAAGVIARYQTLPPTKRAEVTRNIERRLTRENYDLLQSIQGLQQGRAAYAMKAPLLWYEPREFAPVATARTVIRANAESHQRATRGMRPCQLLPDMAAAVTYDWQRGTTVADTTELSDDQRFTNMARGYAPGADHAVARVLAMLDQNPQQRQLGEYFEHLYADRDGAVFAGVTLYDAWRSGVKIEMPDTDTIAYARLVLGTEAYVAPIPDNRRRERLYQKLANGYAAHHEHRTLCMALAATFTAADPQLDPAWQNLVDRCHWLWQVHARDAKAVANHLRQAGGRSDLLFEVDAAMTKDKEPVHLHRQAMAQLADYLRQCLDRELREAGV